jgi:hypothetical protein
MHIAAEHPDPCHDGVHVRILETRQDKTISSVDDLGARSAQDQDILVAPDSDDAAR